MSADQTHEIEWRDGVLPVSVRFDDPYFSMVDGMAETHHVFLQGNKLPSRFRPGFHIAELGFGTGLNMLCALDLWIQSAQQGQLEFTSFEAFPLSARDMKRSLDAFPALETHAEQMLEFWAGGARKFETTHLKAEIIIGDARDTVPIWKNNANAWFLDGFSPAKNPELWSDDLMQAVADHTRPSGTFASYTAAGHVRRALASAGFSVDRHAGYGRKRHMISGELGATK